MKKIYILFLTLIALTIFAAYLFLHSERKELTVLVVNDFTKEPISNIRIAVRCTDGCSLVDRGHQEVQQTDAEGISIFRLVPGFYRLEPLAGYNGNLEINLQEDAEVFLSVLPVY